ncbi:cyclic AMP-dependent transcription factor ATF-4-like [Mizuhopecten yessoensis]|uniref:Basic leucine zipper transcriptional factor ATF-like 3 n=1 Tax=Mizuhopecten yessoensis TaxID=6573 RepID=A0A210QNM1_MIZYE|nr:cyclic AMP-dependent transcription factor ATF-4-like [Mizuhopecten yessoensis]OWF50322.1 Basic leucine zipper transcriptional factor ATF-like 3 [Mizuhopecten yessoensis]
MVRIFVQKELCCSGEPRDVGEGVCSGPREVIDRERAEMAVKAVTQLDGDTNFNYNYNNYISSASFSPDASSQSSFCDSESDNGSLVISEEAAGPVDSVVVSKEEKRKARRRERNKKSAQAYRQRRRQHSGSQVKTLQTLEDKNQVLLQKVQRLEEEKRFIEELLKNKIKIPWHVQWALPPTWQHPTTTTPHPTTTGMMAAAMGAPMSMGSEVTCAS